MSEIARRMEAEIEVVVPLLGALTELAEEGDVSGYRRMMIDLVQGRGPATRAEGEAALAEVAAGTRPADDVRRGLARAHEVAVATGDGDCTRLLARAREQVERIWAPPIVGWEWQDDLRRPVFGPAPGEDEE